MLIKDLVKKHKYIYIFRKNYQRFRYRLVICNYTYNLASFKYVKFGVNNTMDFYIEVFSTVEEIYEKIKNSDDVELTDDQIPIETKKGQLAQLDNSTDTYKKFLLKYPEWLI